jgi:hypothetical protein
MQSNCIKFASFKIMNYFILIFSFFHSYFRRPPSALRRSLTVALLCAALICAACAHQIEITPINKRPLPSGIINSAVCAKGANEYQLTISHLIAPTQLDANDCYYVVWAISANQVENVDRWKGALKGSKTIKVATALPNPCFCVTAEPYPDVNRPSGPTAIKLFIRR